MLAALAAALTAPALAAGDAERGHEIAARWCSSCHVVDEQQTHALADVPTFREIASRHANEKALLALQGFLADPHPVMPDMSLTRQEIRDLVAYIASLRR